MARAVATRGYSATSVANVIELAGVSRTTFYEHFANKDECFLAAYEVMVYRMLKNVRGAQRRSEDPRDALGAAFQALTREVTLEPDAARMVIVEAAKAGNSARRARTLVEAMLRHIPLGPADAQAICAALTRGVFGGVRDVLYRALCERRTTEIAPICAELNCWVATYIQTPSSGVEAFCETKSSTPWRTAIERNLGSLLDFVVGHPNCGRLDFCEVMQATDAAGAGTRAMLEDFLALLNQSPEPGERPPSQITSEAIAAAIWENVHHEVGAGPIHQLHALRGQLSYIALTPLVGSQRPPISSEAGLQRAR
jgi:AcrR family transcriptional regulator